MRKKLFGILLLLAILCGQTIAHSGKPKFQVIIDTDGALDDMRAISMLLSGNDIRVLAITCSEGTLLPDSVYVKVRSLLTAFHHEGIPVGTGEDVNFPVPAWRSFTQNIRWDNASPMQDNKPACTSMELLDNTIEFCQDKITLIALGSLKTYADWIRENKNKTGQIERIIWYNSHKTEDGYNYNLDPGSFEYIRQSDIPLEVVGNSRDDLLADGDYIKHLQSLQSIYASQIEAVLSQALVHEKMKNGHLKLWDDMVPLYLAAPILFESETVNKVKFAALEQNLPPDFVYETIGKLLISSSITNNRVFTAFPMDTTLYKPAYSRMLRKTVEKFGSIEWKAICMTNEVHGHTGIYSIIGAKMGVRAMEYYNVGVNNLTVTTFAGHKPPLSCFNDGVQISSGATIGQGLITVSDSVSSIPSAIFEFNNQKILISLKPEIARQMQNEIKYGIETHGLLTENYWIYIEKLAIDYWTNFNRHDIFIVQAFPA
jgi:inosine-uridine nucleoside N-ribohydrolase